jgi:hypothetical protein
MVAGTRKVKNMGMSMQHEPHPVAHKRARRRRGAATLDYALILGVVMPAAALIMFAGPRIITRVFEMSCTLVSWPFM